MAPLRRRKSASASPSKPSASRTPSRVNAKKRAIDLDLDSSPTRQASRNPADLSHDPTPPKHTLGRDVQDLDDDESRPSRRVGFVLDGDGDSSASEDEVTQDADLMLQLKDNEASSGRGFLNANNPEDAYFLAHSKLTPTSTNLFSSRPNWDPFTVSSYLDALQDRLTSEQAETESLQQSYISRWPQWRAELDQGFSLLFHGLGSKRVTLNTFLEQALVGDAGWEGLVINGFQAGSQLADVLVGLEEIINADHENKDNAVTGRLNSFEALEASARRLCGALNTIETPICVLIHNLDGPAFRNVRIQAILSMLAAQPKLHLLATIDHIYAPVLLPTTLASARPDASLGPLSRLEPGSCGYNFLYHHLPTHLPYTLEAILDGTLSSLLPPTIFPATVNGSHGSKSDVRQNGPTSAKAILHVLSSLTTKAKSLFRLLGQHQTEAYDGLSSVERSHVDQHLTNDSSQDETPAVAMSGRALFELARTEFVASVESQMAALLVEFRDHGIVMGRTLAPVSVTQKRGDEREGLVDDDDEWLWVGLRKDDLMEVLDNMDEA